MAPGISSPKEPQSQEPSHPISPGDIHSFSTSTLSHSYRRSPHPLFRPFSTSFFLCTHSVTKSYSLVISLFNIVLYSNQDCIILSIRTNISRYTSLFGIPTNLSYWNIIKQHSYLLLSYLIISNALLLHFIMQRNSHAYSNYATTLHNLWLTTIRDTVGPKFHHKSTLLKCITPYINS